MAHTFHELKHMTAAQLKDIAKGIQHDAVKGYTQLNKDHLVKAICAALGIEAHEQHQAKGIDKTKIKSKIGLLKTQRAKAIEAHDHKQLVAARQQIKRLKKRLRRAMA
jgi:hypothetical protein